MSKKYPDLPLTTFPDQPKEIAQLENIGIDDIPLMNKYKKLIEEGNMLDARQILIDNPSLKNKIISSDNMNEITQNAVALERFFSDDNTEYKNFINGKYIDWNNRLNQYRYVGVWENTKQYKKDNIVRFDIREERHLFLCLKDTPAGEEILPSNPDYWVRFTIKGDRGETGKGLSFEGLWVKDKKYYVGNVVSFSNALWSCNKENTNQEPTQDTTEFWELMVSVAASKYEVTVDEPANLGPGDFWFRIVAESGDFK